MEHISSFKRRLLPAQRGLRLLSALLVFVFHACSSEKTTATPDEQIKEAWNRYRLSEFSEALRFLKR